jgi:hypothetical protein
MDQSPSADPQTRARGATTRLELQRTYAPAGGPNAGPPAAAFQLPEGIGRVTPSFDSISRTVCNRSYCEIVIGPVYTSL